MMNSGSQPWWNSNYNFIAMSTWHNQWNILRVFHLHYLLKKLKYYYTVVQYYEIIGMNLTLYVIPVAGVEVMWYIYIYIGRFWYAIWTNIFPLISKSTKLPYVLLDYHNSFHGFAKKTTFWNLRKFSSMQLAHFGFGQ